MAAEGDGHIVMPARGICAHRGASDTHPENTLAAFREAIRLGAQMIEFDVALTQDKQLVLMHDATVDRTTNGKGQLSELTLADLRKLDAGSWKADQFAGERIPTLNEVFRMLPDNIWLNVHLKGKAELAEAIARTIIASGRLEQAFLACGAEAAWAAKRIDPKIMICNMERQDNSTRYIDDTIEMKADFIQLLGRDSVDPIQNKRLRGQGIRVNYCCASEFNHVQGLFKAGVEFPLVDNVGPMLRVCDQNGIERLRPHYRSRLQLRELATPYSLLVEQRILEKGSASQGLALTSEHYFTSNSHSICRYDMDWNLIEEKPIRIEGVNHIGAIDHHDGFLWAGLLHGPENGKHDPKLNRSIIAKIRTSDLGVAKTWDITNDVTWIDPVCFDGQHLWVGDLSDLGIHRYRFEGKAMVRDGVLRYPNKMHFSQGIRVADGKLYTSHTFGEMDGLFEFSIPEKLDDEIQLPTRVWQIAETKMHLEGFDFIPGQSGQIWHVQGTQVDRYELKNFKH